MLLGDSGEVMLQLVVTRTDNTNAAILKLWSTGAAEDLKHVQYSQVDKLARLGTIQLRPFDYNGSCRQIDTPGQRCRAAKYFDSSFGKDPLHEIPIRSRHSSMVCREAVWNQVSQFSASCILQVAHRPLQRRLLRTRRKHLRTVVVDRHLMQHSGSIDGILS